MNPTFDLPPIWYVMTAIVWAAYHGWRGFLFQYQRATHSLKLKGKESPELLLGASSRIQAIFALAIPDFVLYAFTVATGFAALWLAYALAANLKDLQVGGAATFAFLVVIGVLGITAQLPHLIQNKGWPLVK